MPRPARAGYAKTFAALLVAYALSPIDLIPDFIPVLGYLDELVLLPLGVLLVMKMIPAEILTEYRRQAAQGLERPTSRWGATLIIAVWLLVAGRSLPDGRLAQALMRVGCGAVQAAAA